VPTEAKRALPEAALPPRPVGVVAGLQAAEY